MNRDERTFEDLLNQSEVKDFLQRADREMFPKMRGSALSLVIGTDKPDAKLALEVGAAVLFDKPLLVVIPRGRVIPDGLRRIAAEIVEIDDFTSPAATTEIQKAITRMRSRARPQQLQKPLCSQGGRPSPNNGKRNR
jgi:hypothetical protein